MKMKRIKIFKRRCTNHNNSSKKFSL